MEREYVAFFDSGVGGLTLLSAFCRVYPATPALYFGDNEHAPYGARSEAEIRRFALAAFEEIARFPVRAAVVACNTVTAVCIGELRRRFSFPVIGVEPALRPAARAARGGRLLLLCTRATFASERVRKLLADCPSPVVVRCPSRLAAAVESHVSDLASLPVGEFLPPGRFAATVLGCTHYVWLRRAFAEVLGCPVFDGTEGTLRRLAAVAGLPPFELPVRGGEAEPHAVAGTGAGAEEIVPFMPHAEGKNGGSIGMTDHRNERVDHSIGRADHPSQNTNKCSKNMAKMGENAPIFLGSSAKFDESAFYTLQKEANICSYFLKCREMVEKNLKKT